MELFLQRLGLLFPPDNYVLLLAIVGLPLIGAIVNGVFGKRLGNEAVSLMALASVGLSFAGSLVAFFMLAQVQHGDTVARFVWSGWRWLTLSGQVEADVPVDFALSIDALSATMALVVTGVGFLIHLYSTKYMEGDPGYPRYFSFLNLFIFSMLVLVLGDNLPMLFIGWEGVGLCSYLLIGFWYEDMGNARAGTKAFIANRIGDVGLLVAMAMLAYYVGALDWRGIEAGRTALLQPIQVWPLGNSIPFAGLLPGWASEPVFVNAATIAGLALFLGCAGKSAQIPLYVWLPDAMAGPTPVSALIHAATMVTAGVYLVCRMAGVFVLSPAAMFTIALVGALTALLGASIAIAQNDIKKVLAYSTVSQLGYMFLGAGVGAFTAGFFHVITHAFFKACLFLGAGSVIHAMHARIHDGSASQDIRNMGGLARYLPYTYWTFGASVLAIAGFPLTAGFFSKDEILHRAWTSSIVPATAGGTLRSGLGEVSVFQWPSWAPTLLFVLGVLGALMTAFYMGRLFVLVFWGEFKGWKVVRGEAVHAPHGEAHSGELLTGPKPVESPPAMTVPLLILGALALFGGVFNAHQLSVVGVHLAPLEAWLDPVFADAVRVNQAELVHAAAGAESKVALTIGVSVFVALLGLGGAYWVYVVAKGAPASQLVESSPGLHRWATHKWYVDELYDETIIGAVDSLAELAVWVDRWLVDGIIAGVTSTLVAGAGASLRLLQSGRMQVYAAAMVVGTAALTWFFAMPHATAKTFADHEAGLYRLSAAPGFGYSYRWDGDGDGQWDEDVFSDQRELAFSLDRAKNRTVKLQVKNVLGLVSSRAYAFERPAEPTGAPPPNVLIEIGEDGKPRLRLPGVGTLEKGKPPPPIPSNLFPQLRPEPREKLPQEPGSDEVLP